MVDRPIGGESNDARHFPSYRSGCYAGRPVDACWLCLLRTIGRRVAFRDAATAATGSADLIGRRVEVPNPNHDGPAEEYVEGEVIDVHPTDTSEPAVAVVALDEDRVALPLTRVRFVD